MKGLCKICNKERELYYKNTCQCCYRRQLNKYKNWKQKDNIICNNRKHKKIVKMFLKNKVPKDDIADYFDMTTRNVNFIIKKYCCRCDENGNPKN